LLIERGLEIALVPYFDGFMGTVYPHFSDAAADFKDDSDNQSQIPKSWARVWKIHGSIGWRVATEAVTGAKKVVRLPLIAPGAMQGSQQLQGEAQEIELEALLRSKFPGDLIEPVPKGEFGGDVLHRVISPAGQPCGTILWESKRTKNWTDTWLSKLRDDQRAAKAELALIVSHALPRGVQAFDFIDGIWVTDPTCAMPVAIALVFLR
jgi:hypothetical protein